MNLTIAEFIKTVQSDQKISFDETIDLINNFYTYQPTEFSNGLAEQCIINAAGKNEGSCKLLYFAQLNQLSEQQTLALFGDYYWKDVIEHPAALNHQNIRQFMRYGWPGIAFKGVPLTPKTQF
ncbi:MAG: HopJ type III effector protein [Methylococcaceae bacterium]